MLDDEVKSISNQVNITDIDTIALDLRYNFIGDDIKAEAVTTVKFTIPCEIFLL